MQHQENTLLIVLWKLLFSRPKKKQRCRWYTLLHVALIVCCGNIIFAQNEEINAEEIVIETIEGLKKLDDPSDTYTGFDSLTIICDYPIEIRHFDPEKVTAFKNSSEFLYDKPPPSPSLWQRIMDWLFRDVDGSGWVGFWRFFYDYGIYVLIAGAILFIISKLLNADVSTLFTKSANKSGLPYQILEEDIHQLDFDQLIQQAIGEKNYRRATRLYYLKTLKALTDKGLIDWRINKTNFDYQRELKSTTLSKGFSEITYLFNYTWYGNFPVSEQEFAVVQRDFTQFNQLMSRQ